MAVTLDNAIDILNQSLTDLGYSDYLVQIVSGDDNKTKENLAAIGAFSPSIRNKIMEQMNLIIQQRNFSVIFNAEKNKFRNFLVNMTPNGFGIEDIFQSLIEGSDPLWDDKTNASAIAQDLVSYDDNEIHKFFHTTPFSRQFKTTVDRRNFDKVFTVEGVTSYVNTKLANLANSAEVYFMNVAIDLVKSMISNKHIVFKNGFDINSKNGVDTMVEAIKSTCDGFLTPCAAFNKGVPSYNAATNTHTFTPQVNITPSMEDVFIIATPEAIERLKVRGYSNAFNLSEFELQGRLLLVPYGTSLGTVSVNGVNEDVQFVVLDRRALLLGIKMWDGSSNWIPNVFRTNHWLTVEGVKGYNTVMNAVAFTGAALGNFLEEAEGGGYLGNKIAIVEYSGDKDFVGMISSVVYGTNSLDVSVLWNEPNESSSALCDTNAVYTFDFDSGKTLTINYYNAASEIRIYVNGEQVHSDNSSGTYSYIPKAGDYIAVEQLI